MNLQKPIVKAASNLFPKLVASYAYDQAMNPQVRKLRPNELIVLDKAEKEKIPFKSFTIQTYKWGNPEGEKVLLIHGWEGQAGNFADLVEKLVDNGFFVISFDGPAHGFSSKGDNILLEFIDLVGMLIKHFDCKKLVSHSFGGVATTNALYNNPDIEIEKYALLTTPDKFSQRIDDIVVTTGVSQKVKQLLIDRIERESGLEVKNMGVSSVVSGINVKEARIFHDKHDRVVPLTQSQTVCELWENCSLQVVEGTGHFRILRTESVLQEVLHFLN